MIYRDFEKVLNNCFGVMGSGLCLAKSNLVSAGKNASEIYLSIQQLTLPDYHKSMFNSSVDAIYHIAGYGQSNEEAITRAVGETIERFSFMSMYFLVKDIIKKGSYEQLELQSEILPIDFLNITIKNSFLDNIKRTDEISWLRLKNYSTGKMCYYPFCLIASEKDQQRPMLPAMSTGTATHISQEKALLNAMIEKLQIHLFLTAWYGKKKMPIVDWKESCSCAFQKIFCKTYMNTSNFEITVLDCGLAEIGFKNYVTIIKGKNIYPAYAIGVQGGFNAEETLLRSMMEATAIYINLQSFYLFKEDYLHSLTSETVLNEYNLDAPFLYWSNYNDLELKDNFISEISDYNHKIALNTSESYKNEKDQLEIIFSYFKKTLNYFSVMDISPPEIKKYGYSTIRVIAPELISMNLPGLTYDNHPYFLKNGGITNGHLTHPLP